MIECSMTIAARELAEGFGWSVFPLVNRKAPLGQEKYDSRWGCSNNLDEINRRFNRVNNCNGVGMATGESGLLVLDIDTKTAHASDGFGPIAELENVYGRLPDTVTSRSPSGGVHLYFKGVKGIANSASKVGLGLDIRARGGFVVAPPSNHGQGHYEWLSSPYDQEIAEAPHWLIYKAMFAKRADAALLASVGIISRHDLNHLDPNEWREHVDRLIAQQRVDEKAARDAKRVRKSLDQSIGIHNDQREKIDDFALFELSLICENLTSLSTPTGDRNTRLNSEAARVGHLIAHPTSNEALSRDHAFSALMAATDCWGERHDENRRAATINSGLDNGEVAVRSREEIRWIEAKLDNILCVHVEEAGDDLPIANDVDFLSVDDARAMVSDGVETFMRQAFEWKRKNISLGSFVDDQYGPSRLIVAGAGTGKSQAIINVMKDYDGSHGPLLHFAPSLELCDDLASRYEEAGIPVAVLRGRSAVDPSVNSEDDRMCPRWRMAEVAGQSNVSVTRMLCGDGEEVPHCPFFETCSYRKQALGAHVIVLPHSHLLNEGHELLPDDIFSVVIDEDFTSNLVVSPQSSDAKVLCAGDILTPARPPENDETSEVWKSDKAAELLTYQDKLRIATERSQGGYLTQQALLDAGFEPWNGTIFFNEDGDQRCDDFEPLKLATFALLWAFCGVPVGDDEQLYCDQLAERRKWLTWIAVWAEVGHILDDDGFSYNRSTLLYCDSEGGLRVGEIKQIASKYHNLPTLLIDATPPPDTKHLSAMGIAAPKKVCEAFTSAPHQTTKFVLNAPTSKAAMSGGQSYLKEVGRSIAREVFEHENDPKKVLVVTHKPLRESLEERLPKDITVLHYGALRGLDTFRDFEAMYCVGAPQPSGDGMMATEDAIRGSMTGSGDGSKARSALVTKSEEKVAVSFWGGGFIDHATDGELIQAMGRLRGVNRTSENPCRVVILADRAPCVEVDEVITWQTFRATQQQTMKAAGIVPFGPVLGEALYPWLFKQGEARHYFESIMGKKRPFADLPPPASLSGHAPHIPYKRYYIKGSGVAVPIKNEDVRLIGSTNYTNTEVDHSKLEYCRTVLGFEIEIKGERHQKITDCLDRHGFVLLNKRHAHRLAPDIWANDESARRHIAGVSIDDGEVGFEYVLCGRGQAKTMAIFSNNIDENEARSRVESTLGAVRTFSKLSKV